ncbi:DgyrCDS1078 [Dimorphilus gyrociliatus]|uniref:DgyrCDS1078 n=1 Tax=Dimorphilus gyrociliatus TaxID=2664684 RepID=A0A7I8V674_9ANNE|nr:DgyrCDS1078 [Dimorphilus gyrociliatus]
MAGKFQAGMSKEECFEKQLEASLEFAFRKIKVKKYGETKGSRELLTKNWNRVKCFTSSLYKSFQKLSIHFSKCIDEEFELGGIVQQLNFYEFNLRIPMSRSIHQDAFQILSGIHKGISSGRAVYRFSDKLTAEESRAELRKWGHLLNEDTKQISSAYVYFYLIKGVQEVIKRATFKIEIISKVPILQVSLACSQNKSVGNDDKNLDAKSNYVTVNIIPVIRGKGWPAGASVNNPMPKKPPMCFEGTRILHKIKNQIDFGNILWSLEGQVTDEILQVFPSASLKQYKKLLLEKTFPGYWSINFLPVLKLYVHEIFRIPHLTQLQKAIKLFENLSLTKNTLKILQQDIICNITLKICRQHANANFSLAVWFMLFLDYMIFFVASGNLPLFLDKRINMLAHVEEDKLSTLRVELLNLKMTICENPKKVEQMFLQKCPIAIEKVQDEELEGDDHTYSPGHLTPEGSSLWCTSFKDNKSEDTMSMISSKRATKEQLENIDDKISVSEEITKNFIETNCLELENLLTKYPNNENNKDCNVPPEGEELIHIKDKELLLSENKNGKISEELCEGIWAKKEYRAYSSSSSYAESCGIISPLQERKFQDPFENRMLPYHPEDHPSASSSSSMSTELGSRDGDRNLTTVQEESDEKEPLSDMSRLEHTPKNLNNQ